MTITLNHTIVPAHDKEASARFFAKIFARVKEAGIEYSSDPMHQNKGQINHWNKGRGFYFYDSNGHNLELLTRA
ncbi:MAG: hypothetical protein V7K92_00145 [Nostoc sp.]|uniref:hypothetical protein n=1 Tax=Nostoc sp. TaxID=1180 RepID=UPI002FF424DA